MKRDPKAFKDLWRLVADPLLESLRGKYGIVVSERAEGDVHSEYDRFNEYCSANYMEDPNKELDRHKVVACFILAIVSASPISLPSDFAIEGRAKDEQVFLRSINENFAISVGASLLRAFMLCIAKGKPAGSFSELDENLREGIPFDELFEVNHGERYTENLAVSLYYSKCEMSYNILLLADIVYHWEAAMLSAWGIDPLGK